MDTALQQIGTFFFWIRLFMWIVVMLGFLIVLVLIGHRVHKRPAGILIDSTNHISLSRLQVILWTVLALSSYLIFASIRLLNPLESLPEGALRTCITDEMAEDPPLTETEATAVCSRKEPLHITFPEELILVMGISVASFAGSTLIQSTKKNMQLSPVTEQTLKDNAIRAATTSAGTASTSNTLVEDAIKNKVGVLQTNKTPAEASWLDLFCGNEVADFQYVQIGKVQMFLFTIIVLFAYFIAIAALLASNDLLHPLSLNFPPFSDTLNVLLGISHAGYLSVKAVNQS